jgi:hypothetical protein
MGLCYSGLAVLLAHFLLVLYIDVSDDHQGDNPTNLTDDDTGQDTGQDFAPAYSPNGKRIAVATSSDEAEFEQSWQPLP